MPRFESYHPAYIDAVSPPGHTQAYNSDGYGAENFCESIAVTLLIAERVINL
jgi:hypothetical protein